MISFRADSTRRTTSSLSPRRFAGLGEEAGVDRPVEKGRIERLQGLTVLLRQGLDELQDLDHVDLLLTDLGDHGGLRVREAGEGRGAEVWAASGPVPAITRIAAKAAARLAALRPDGAETHGSFLSRVRSGRRRWSVTGAGYRGPNEAAEAYQITLGHKRRRYRARPRNLKVTRIIGAERDDFTASPRALSRRSPARRSSRI